MFTVQQIYFYFFTKLRDKKDGFFAYHLNIKHRTRQTENSMSMCATSIYICITIDTIVGDIEYFIFLTLTLFGGGGGGAIAFGPFLISFNF